MLKHKGSIVHSVSSDSTVRDAVRLMNRQRIGAVLVIDQGQLVGIFTERDVLVRVVDAERDPRTTIIADVMTAKVTTVSPEMRVSEALRLVTEQRMRHLPVMEGRRLLGLISLTDLSGWTTQFLQAEVQYYERTVNAPMA
ncbi:MAG: CBS domain-containing protein [Myxococcota bacterium]